MSCKSIMKFLAGTYKFDRARSVTATTSRVRDKKYRHTDIFLLHLKHDKNKIQRNPMVVVDVNNLKNGRKPVKLQKESPAECAGEGKQSKGN